MKHALSEYNRILETETLLSIDKLMHALVISAFEGNSRMIFCQDELLKEQLKKLICEHIDKQYDAVYLARCQEWKEAAERIPLSDFPPNSIFDKIPEKVTINEYGEKIITYSSE